MKKMEMWFAAALIAVCGTAIAAEATEKTGQPAGQQSAMSPEEKMFREKMGAFLKSAEPAAEHKMLEGMVGDFNAKVTIWLGPGATGMSHVGTSENRWVLGDKFVQEIFTGEVMGVPFNGLGYVGYDKKKKSYVSYWIDNIATHMMYGEQVGPDAPAIGPSTAPEGSFVSLIRFPREVWRLTIQKSQNVYSWEMWSPGPGGGPMFKEMEIVYTRK